MDDALRSAARYVYEAGKIVVFTGAGISTESGIPDFRSPGGTWSRYNPDDLTYQRFRSHEKFRKLYWQYDRERYPAIRDAKPNPAHLAVVEIERTGRLLALVTQNIDGLHQKAGNSPEKVFELHGTVHEVTCLDCHSRWSREEITDRMDREGLEIPYCSYCNGPLKCATIAFGQSLPAEVLEAGFSYAGQCDLFVTVGSSLVVQPAAMLPLEAKRHGARLILVNDSETPYDHVMDVIVRGKAGPIMSGIIEQFKMLAQP